MFQRIDLVLRAGDIDSEKMIQDLMNEYASDQKDKDYEKYWLDIKLGQKERLSRISWLE